MDEIKQREFLEICRRNGWKCTSQRLAVYDCVRENYTHPGVEDVLQHVKETLHAVSRESVYRILNEFAACGILQRLDHVENARYDCQTGPQGHFICEICERIIDFAFPEQLLLRAKNAPGEVRHIELRISGICKQCMQQKNQKEETKS